MSPTSLYPVVAGASLLLALWQPADADTHSAEQPETRAVSSSHADRASQRIDERAARHKERWEQRKADRKLAAGNGS